MTFSKITLGLNLILRFIAADHLDPAQISPTVPEHRIGVLLLEKTTITQIESMYGKPNKITTNATDTDQSAGERQYYWNLSGCKLSVGTYFRPSQESPITAIAVSGSSRRMECVTGRGLKLGSSLFEVRQKYWRFQQGRKSTDKRLYVLVEWADGIQADIDFDSSNKVNQIQIRSSVE